jgi:hypothetical protein
MNIANNPPSAPLAPWERAGVRDLRSNLLALEAIELLLLFTVIYIPLMSLYLASVITQPEVYGSVLSALLGVVMMGAAGVAALFFLWGVYLLYIRIARWGGPAVDVGLWVICSLATATFTFWCWTVLDINRWIVAKLLYRGEVPVEYAWSAPSKRRRKDWEAARQAAAYLAQAE